MQQMRWYDCSQENTSRKSQGAQKVGLGRAIWLDAQIRGVGRWWKKYMLVFSWNVLHREGFSQEITHSPLEDWSGTIKEELQDFIAVSQFMRRAFNFDHGCVCVCERERDEGSAWFNVWQALVPGEGKWELTYLISQHFQSSHHIFNSSTEFLSGKKSTLMPQGFSISVILKRFRLGPAF